MTSGDSTTPSAAQIRAVNAVIDDLGGLNRSVLQSEIRQLPGILRQDELPEKILVVEYKGNDTCLLVVTNLRFMFLTEKFFSFGKLQVRDFSCDEITFVDWAPGRFRHRITIHMGDKKEECYGLWRDGQFPVRKMAEHLRSKISGSSASVANDARTAKAHAIEDIVRESLGLSGADRMLVSAELKQLPDILGQDEMPERFMPAEYDARHGLMISATENRHGLLIATDRRLLFIHKRLGFSREVNEFPYDTIDHVEFSKGILFGQITVYSSGLEEIFKVDGLKVESFAEYLRGEIAVHATAPDKSKADAISDAILKLGGSKDLLGKNWMDRLPNILEDGELPEKMAIAVCDGCDGILFAMASRLIFFVPANGISPFAGKPSFECKSLPYSAITSIESSPGIFFGKFTINSSGNKETFDQLSNGNIRELGEFIQAKMPTSESTPPIPPTTSLLSVADELEKLHGLVEKGILTQEEFEVQKEKLLQL